ncbi:MAG: hypothetical protein FWD03_02990 [Defluviitaleaceae bacterium]|nr:hypothetical protein [Defluviitaleaceae bacterium]
MIEHKKREMVKKVIWIFTIIAIMLIIGLVAIILSNPLRRSSEQIRADILEITPIGMSMEDVLNIIEDNDQWEIRRVSYDFGFYKQAPNERPRTVGEKSITVRKGHYRSILMEIIVIDVFWGFDENSQLIDIWVWKAGLMRTSL